MNTYKILIIDDDIIVRTQIETMLSNKYQVVSANNGLNGLNTLKNFQFDVILLDILLPDIPGLEVLHEIKKIPTYINTPVIIMAEEDSVSYQINSFNNKAFDYIVKPINFSVLMARIKKAVDTYQVNFSLHEKINEKNSQLDNYYKKIYNLTLQLISSLSKAVEAKDRYTRGHSERVAKYACIIGEKLGLSTMELDELNYSALLHDIGKIGVPEEIINKPGKLTKDETSIMRSHTLTGFNILKKISEIPQISTGARWHHEKYNGEGYPDRLKGADIPLIARIIAIADAYDAMSSYRPYREPLPQEIIISEFEKEKGEQFDPKITEIMIDIIKKDTEYKYREYLPETDSL